MELTAVTAGNAFAARLSPRARAQTNRVLTTLILSTRTLGADAAKAIAEALKVLYIRVHLVCCVIRADVSQLNFARRQTPH